MGVTPFGMSIIDMPAETTAYPEHDHSSKGPGNPPPTSSARRRSISRCAVRPTCRSTATGTSWTRPHHPVGPTARRQILPGPDGVRLLAIGGFPGRDTIQPPPSEAKRETGPRAYLVAGMQEPFFLRTPPGGRTDSALQAAAALRAVRESMVLKARGLCRRRIAAWSVAAPADPVECQSDEHGDDRGLDREIGEIEAAAGEGGLDPVDDPAAQWSRGTQETVQEVADPSADQQANRDRMAGGAYSPRRDEDQSHGSQAQEETSTGCPRRMLPGPAKFRYSSRWKRPPSRFTTPRPARASAAIALVTASNATTMPAIVATSRSCRCLHPACSVDRMIDIAHAPNTRASDGQSDRSPRRLAKAARARRRLGAERCPLDRPTGRRAASGPATPGTAVLASPGAVSDVGERPLGREPVRHGVVQRQI